MMIASVKKLLRRTVNWVLIGVAAMFGVGFAVANRESVVVRFNPLGDGPLALQLPPMPLFLVILLSVFCGIVLGCVAGWFSAGGMRQRARGYKRENKSLKREIKSKGGDMPPAPPASAGSSLPVPVASPAAAQRPDAAAPTRVIDER